MRYLIPPQNYELYERFCETLCDEIEDLIDTQPLTPQNRFRLSNKQFLLDRFTWMIQRDLGHSGAPDALVRSMFEVES